MNFYLILGRPLRALYQINKLYFTAGKGESPLFFPLISLARAHLGLAEPRPVNSLPAYTSGHSFFLIKHRNGRPDLGQLAVEDHFLYIQLKS